MIAEQTCLLPSVAETKLRIAEGILQRFLDWHNAGCILGPDRVVLTWFANDVKEYFETGTDWEAA